MIRKNISPRNGWQQKLENSGFLFHTPDGETYWNESACYELSLKESNAIEDATNALLEICHKGVEAVIERGWYERLGINSHEADLIQKSWDLDHLSVYGRFDLSWDFKAPPKMLEFNADTPTSLFEASVIQWQWLEEVFPHYDQFNSIHEKLIKRWNEVANKQKTLHFTSLMNHADDISQTEYLRDTAHQAGFQTEFIFIEDLGYDFSRNQYVDLDDRPIEQCFKLYPWEWLSQEQFGKYINLDKTKFVEPAWKRIMSSKAFLPVLWELNPGHPNLLPSFFERPTTGKVVEKPFVSREGNQIKIWENGSTKLRTEGFSEDSRSIYQAYHELPCFDGRYPVLGSWIVGESSAGLGIREDSSVVTQSTSHFVPHYLSSRRK
ncbi:glutathionylspermidine synthase family protein [Bdellovibrio bacteriovorus]|uniref:glutathionylspermidine synthase family protein n=1 Tax=Bdellovibrio bacteriovorus TaxID=959 RepID=UPI003A7FBB2F